MSFGLALLSQMDEDAAAVEEGWGTAEFRKWRSDNVNIATLEFLDLRRPQLKQLLVEVVARAIFLNKRIEACGGHDPEMAEVQV